MKYPQKGANKIGKIQIIKKLFEKCNSKNNLKIEKSIKPKSKKKLKCFKIFFSI